MDVWGHAYFPLRKNGMVGKKLKGIVTQRPEKS